MIAICDSSMVFLILCCIILFLVVPRPFKMHMEVLSHGSVRQRERYREVSYSNWSYGN